MSAPRILLLSDDLMAPSRVREALRPFGWPLVVVATNVAFDAALSERPEIALVALNTRRADPLGAIQTAKAAGVKTLAFAGHVEKEKHDDARAAGADLVAANSSVAMHLPALLRQMGLPVPEDPA